MRPCYYSKISILRPPLGLSKSGLKDHFWTVPKVVSNQRYTDVENEENNNLNFANKDFKVVLIAKFHYIYQGLIPVFNSDYSCYERRFSFPL